MFSWFGYDFPIERRLALIKQAGFDSTCLWLGNEEAEVRAGRQDSLPSLVHDAGLVLDNVHASYEGCNRLWASSVAVVNEAVEEYGGSVQFCGEHAIPIVVMHVSEGVNPPPMTAQGLSAIERLARLAEESGVVIALENTRRPDYLGAVFSKVRSPCLRFCYDSSHDFMGTGSHGELLRRWGRLVVTTHLSDSNQTDSDDHLIPGRGTIGWTALASCLREHRYGSSLMIEVDGEAAAQHGLSAEEFLRECYGWLRDFLTAVVDG